MKKFLKKLKRILDMEEKEENHELSNAFSGRLVGLYEERNNYDQYILSEDKHVEEKKKEVGVLFKRMMLLAQKLIVSDTLKVEYAKDDEDNFCSALSDEKSKMILKIAYSEKRSSCIVINYGGLSDQIEGDLVKQYESTIKDIQMISEEYLINSLEEELTERK